MTMHRKRNSSQNSELVEENRLQKGQKHSIHWEGDGVSFLGREKNHAH